ncbi:trichohyalin, partial [Thraustotheca clavata]
SNSRASMRTLDKEKIRQRALYLNMKEKLRMSICVRIQKQCRKTPAQAQILAQQVLESVQTNGLSSNLSDSELEQLVRQLSRPGQEPPKEKTPQKEMTPKKDATPPASGKKSRKSLLHDKKHTGVPPPIESVYVTESQLQQASVGFVLPPRKSPQKHKQDDIWNTLIQVKVKQRSSWNEELNAQVQDKLRRKSVKNHEDQKYYEETMQKLEQMNQEERTKELDRIVRAKEQNKIQEEQRQYKMAKKQLELETRRQAELHMAEAVTQQKAHEEAKEIARKEAEKIKMERVLKENEALLEKKRQIKQEDRELELKLADDYIKMEEKKDAMRQHGLDELSKKIQAKMKFFDDTSKAEIDMKNKQEEIRILRYQQDYDQKQAQLDEKKREDAIKRNHDQQEYLKQQMKLKKERERQEKEYIDTDEFLSMVL